MNTTLLGEKLIHHLSRTGDKTIFITVLYVGLIENGRGTKIVVVAYLTVGIKEVLQKIQREFLFGTIQIVLWNWRKLKVQFL